VTDIAVGTAANQQTKWITYAPALISKEASGLIQKTTLWPVARCAI